MDEVGSRSVEERALLLLAEGAASRSAQSPPRRVGLRASVEEHHRTRREVGCSREGELLRGVAS